MLAILSCCGKPFGCNTNNSTMYGAKIATVIAVLIQCVILSLCVNCIVLLVRGMLIFPGSLISTSRVLPMVGY